MKKSTRAKVEAAATMSRWVRSVGTHLRESTDPDADDPEPGFYNHPMHYFVWSIGAMMENTPTAKGDWRVAIVEEELPELPDV